MKKKFEMPDILSRLLAVIIIATFLSIMNPNFLKLTNILNVFNQASLNVLLAIAMTMVMLVGGIDLSVGSVLAISTCLVAKCFVSESIPVIALGILGAMLVGILCGMANGSLVAYFDLPPFLVTYGISQISRGFAYLLMNGKVVNKLSSNFKLIGKGRIGGVFPVPIIIAFVFLVIMAVFLKKSVLGRQIYTVGANPSAARYSGINIRGIKILCYALSGLFSALGGIVYVSRLDAVESTIGTSYANDAIAAAAIAGVSFNGGKGNIFGTVIGTLLLVLIKNGMNMLGIATEYQKLVTGAVIIIAVLIDRKSTKKN